MQYRLDKYGNPISILGYGCMRFTKRGNSFDIDKAEKEVMTAIRQGVNYLDTAFAYLGNEVAVGEILSRNNCRKQVNIATKLPQYLVKSREVAEKYFQEELSRLKTDYIDYYLMHMLTDVVSWEKLKGIGIEEWIQEKKNAGQIRNIGFSFHGNTEMFLRLLDVYDWDFCQIQYNYMDEHSQAGKKGLKAAYEKGIPVIIMEPLRGGKLVDLLPEEAKRLIAMNERNWSCAEWALRWLWEQPEVMCVLSGMNSLEMVEENLRIASEAQVGEFTHDDFEMIQEIKKEINRYMKVGCTACGYCLPCPANVDIPGAFRCYNAMYMENKKSGRTDYLRSTAMRHEPSSASNCVGCGKCEQHCPQALPIRKHLKEAARELETPLYRLFKVLVKRFRFW